MAKNNKQNKAREKLIEMYVKSLEDGKIPWRMGWDDSFSKPQNPVTKTQYHGVNLLMLNYIAMMEGYKDPRWCTLKQANEKGWTIKRGSHGTPVEYWMPYDLEQRKYLTWKEYQKMVGEAKERGEDLNNITLYCKISYVFNADQIHGIPDYKKDYNNTIETSPFVENLITNMNVHYMEMGATAYYSPNSDMVVIPERGFFESDYDYNSTRLHELCHATGHESRLNRPMLNEFGSQEYAKEELRAEIASSFIGQSIGLQVSEANLDNHKAYIQSWINVLNNEPDELFRSIKEAQSIENFILDVGEFERFKIMENETGQKIFYQDEHVDYFTFDKMISEKDTVVLCQLGIPIVVDSGFKDKDGLMYSSDEIDMITEEMSIEEEDDFYEKNEIREIATQVSTAQELLDMADKNDGIVHGYLSPDFISSDKAEAFIYCFDYMTDDRFGFYTLEECNHIQMEMLLNAPLDMEKFKEFVNKYLTEESILRSVENTKQNYRENIDPYEVIKSNIQSITSSQEDEEMELEKEEGQSI